MIDKRSSFKTGVKSKHHHIFLFAKDLLQGFLLKTRVSNAKAHSDAQSGYRLVSLRLFPQDDIRPVRVDRVNKLHFIEVTIPLVHGPDDLQRGCHGLTEANVGEEQKADQEARSH